MISSSVYSFFDCDSRKRKRAPAAVPILLSRPTLLNALLMLKTNLV